MSAETSVKPSPDSGGASPLCIQFAQTGAWLCGVTGRFDSGFVSVARAVGADAVALIWVKEIRFEVIALRPARTIGVAVIAVQNNLVLGNAY